MEYQLGECKSCDAIADQIAELTKTNLEQAAQIEMLREVLWETNKFVDQTYADLIGSLSSEWLAARYVKVLSPLLSKALSTTPFQALEAFAAKVRNEAYEKTADICDDNGLYKTANEIRNLKETQNETK